MLGVAAAIVLVPVGAFAWSSASSTRASRPASSTCEQRLLEDWRDGRIDGTYPLPCYQRAINELPADMRTYSSAEQDIRQARADRIVQSATRTPS